MNLIKLCTYAAAFFCISCSAASPTEKKSEFSCPYVLPAADTFPASWLTVRKIPSGKFQLQGTDIAFGNAIDLKNRLLSEDRSFDAEITDDWTYFNDRAEFKADYAQDHEEISILCTYGKTRAESNDANLNVELLIPLPKNKPANCLLVRRDLDPKYEISCKVK